MASIKCLHCNLINFSTAAICKRCQNPITQTNSFTRQAPLHQTYNRTIQNDSDWNSQAQAQSEFPQSVQNQYPPTQYPQPIQNQFAPYQAQQFQPPIQSQYQQPTAFQGYQNIPPPPVFYGNLYQSQKVYSTCIKCGDYKDVSIRKLKKDFVPPAVYLAFLIGILPGALLVSLLRVKHEINATFCARCWNNFASIWWIESLSVFGFAGILIIAAIAGGISGSLFAFLCGLALAIGSAVAGIKYKKKHSPIFKRVNRHEVTITDPVNGDISFSS